MTSEDIKHAVDLIKSGDKATGKQILTKLVEAEPNNELAWMWLSACEETEIQKIHCLEKVISINPANEKVKAALDRLRPMISEPDITEIITRPSNAGMNQISQKITNQIGSPRPIEFIPAACPKCGGELRVPADMKIIKCMYCGNDVLINNPNQINVNLELKIDISKPMKLGKAAEEGENYKEGYKYYTQVLEQDEQNVEAWFGKARCAVWIGTVSRQTIDEAISYVKNGMAIKDPHSNSLSKTIWNIANATASFMTLVSEDLDEEIERKSPRLRSPDPVFALAATAGQARVAKQINQKFIHTYFPIIYRSVLFCWASSPTKGVGEAIYRTITNIRLSKNLDQDTMDHVDSNLKDLVGKIQGKYPDLPLPDKKKSCFIATAAMGDIDHPYVVTLRQFRDQYLSKSTFGRTFIDIYYRYSPPLAKIIADHSSLRKITREVVIKPFYRITLKILDRNKEYPISTKPV